MGYRSSKGYRIFCLKSEKQILNREVKCDEATGWYWKITIPFILIYFQRATSTFRNGLVDDVLIRENRSL